MMEPVQVVARQIWREGFSSAGSPSIPEEIAVALTYNGGTYAVMMATPQDLAVRMADAAGITLAAIARADGFEVFTHPCRISNGAVAVMARSLEANSMPTFQRSTRCENLS
jgi:formate dehydrogenase assembly factor FdhD